MFREFIYIIAFCIVMGFIGAAIIDIFPCEEGTVRFLMRMDYVFIRTS